MDNRATYSGSANSGGGSVSAPVILALGLAVLLAVRLVGLSFNATDLFFDEAQYWSWSREPAFGYYSKPPLIAWIIGLATTVCGDSTACIRLPAPLLHTATAVVVYLIGKRLHGTRVGLWSGLAFATLPGVSLSSSIISTDVPLLACWLWPCGHWSHSRTTPAAGARLSSSGWRWAWVSTPNTPWCFFSPASRLT